MPYYPFTKNVQSTSHSSFQVFLSFILKPTNTKHIFSSSSKQKSNTMLSTVHLVMKSVKSKFLNPNYIGNALHELGVSWNS